MTTTCPKCKREVDAPDLRNRSGRSTWCKQCRKEHAQRFRKHDVTTGASELATSPGPLQNLIRLAGQAAVFKYRALSGKPGMARQKNWLLHFRTAAALKTEEKRVLQLLEED